MANAENSSPLTVAMIGGGQLARMSAPAAAALGINLRVLVESELASAAQAVVDAPVGAANDPHAVHELVGPEAELDDQAGAAVLTFEHEHIPDELLRKLQAEGRSVQPGPDALVHAQDKLVMRAAMDELGLPNPAWARAENADDVAAFLAENSGEAIAKTPRGGYDGKGVRVIRAADEIDDWLVDGPILLEEKVDFARELAVLVARRPSGQVAVYPVVETIQRDGVCSEVIAPAPDLDSDVNGAALAAAEKIAAGLNVTGVLAVEMFERSHADAAGNRIAINELAMRPHNSGHWTIEGAVTSQFENHLRAVLDLPLGSTRPLAPWAVMANILGGSRVDLASGLPIALADGEIKVHLYGKEVRPGRKVGHVTAVGEDLETVRSRAVVAAAQIKEED
ncbi:MAG TPA: 5-(carboxyamino)imidazole ribonucleotide synthase [Actinomycetales bacterium]|nr:5-(carboxyamino)imidazole ribonucleotide synthase [Actinomycetales bacterium]